MGLNPSSKNNVLLALQVIILLVSIGAGIGIGYAIGASSSDNDGGSAEPIYGTEESHSTKHRPTEPRPTEPQPTDKQSTDQRPTTDGPENPTTPPPPFVDWIDRPCADHGARCPAGISSPPLLLISMDGFRADFLSRGLTPVINRIAECGVSTPYMIPSFPTLTFPNHYSIVTGMYPEAHGIVGNTIHDFGTTFSIGSSESVEGRWWGGEPIWNTARWQGKRSASFFWTGSEADIQGIRPNYWNKYDGDVNYIQRVDTVLGWLRLPDGYRPDMVTLYFDEPDHLGHDPGPDSDEENEVLQRMDGMMRRMMDGLAAMDMLDCVNIILVADHGMSHRTCSETFILNDYLTSSDYRIVTTGGTMLRMLAEAGATVSDPEEIVEELLCKHEVAIPYLKEDLPKRWHYSFNDRIEPVEVTVPEQWTASGGDTTWCDGGTHGYDNLGNLMKALFVAIGPGFKSQVETKPFQNIELYNLMCELLDLEPAPNNGTMGSLHHIMRSPKPLSDVQPNPVPEMECPFPATNPDYDNRVQNDTSGCICNAVDVKTYDKQLDLSDADVQQAMAEHAPFGVPEVTVETMYCHLTQTNYITGYSHDMRTPLWSSYTLRQPQSFDSAIPLADCAVRPDVRVDNDYSPSCSDYDGLSDSLANLGFNYLYSPSFSSDDSKMDAMISSNIVPQFIGFVQDVWDGFLIPHLSHWANISLEINVVVGPVFDYNSDGFGDNNNTVDGITFGDTLTLLPTHFFMVVTRCKGGEVLNDACAEVQSAAFVLRNSDGIKTCQTQADYVEHHVATINDIEKLTGLRFFPNMDVYDAIALKLYAPSKTDLWRDWPLMDP
ncbi:venom phosphodiesterase 2-like [Diadema setosum]|uniref:venom phosphodiesterase 2-like n=1 Tax=Diadema setosum TaxID=31175 RepID=UPI003B3B4F2E